MSFKDPPQRNELHLVWLQDPAGFTYLREAEFILLHGGPPRKEDLPEGALLVGYAELAKAGAGGRRVWWLMPHDRDRDANNVYKRGSRPSAWPTEAVAPSSIEANAASRAYRDDAWETRPRA